MSTVKCTVSGSSSLGSRVDFSLGPHCPPTQRPQFDITPVKEEPRLHILARCTLEYHRTTFFNLPPILQLNLFLHPGLRHLASRQGARNAKWCSTGLGSLASEMLKTNKTVLAVAKPTQVEHQRKGLKPNMIHSVK